MDAKGAWRDKVFVERLGRTIKYEAMHLRAYASVQDARTRVGDTSTTSTTPATPFEPWPLDEAYFNVLSSIRRKPNQGRNPSNDRPENVQINRTTSFPLP